MSDRSLRLDLLDQQLVDADGRPVGRVDDALLQLAEDHGPPVVTAVLTGMEALGARVGGPAGRLAARSAGRLREDDGPAAIPVGQIAQTGSLVRLRVPLRDLPHVAPLERWLAEHFVERLPGTGDARD